MTVDAKDVYQILTNDGTMNFGQGNVRYPGNGGIKSFGPRPRQGQLLRLQSDNRQEQQQHHAGGPGSPILALTRLTSSMKATMRRSVIDATRYMFSDGFAGCDFFLYRGASGAVTGVHASRELYKFRDPQPYFSRRGVFEPLWHWKSRT